MVRADDGGQARSMTTATPPLAQPTELPQAPQTQLRRSATDRMIAGVCGGLAEYSRIDVVLWRVGFVALTVLGGSGILFYALLWVLMPSAPGADRNVLDRFADRLRSGLAGAARDLGRP
jgi:phage shock protein C